MKLSRLVRALPPSAGPSKALGLTKLDDPEIASVHYRAQEVTRGGLFVAIQGLVADGHDYIPEAIKRGAAAVVTQRPTNNIGPAALVVVPDTRTALAHMAAAFYGRPSDQLFVIGITGTNGKTTTAYLIEKILATAGLAVGVIGTIDYRYAGQRFDNPVTTPESLDLQRILAAMVVAGTTHVVMEVSSHGLDLKRVHGCSLDMGIFTNLTQDHLDYHGDMDHYWRCKKLLFEEHLHPGDAQAGPRYQAVINGDADHGRALIEEQRSRLRVLVTGSAPKAHIRPDIRRQDHRGTFGVIETPEGPMDLASPLTGRHNLENILNAVGAGVALDLPLITIAKGIGAVTKVPGRLESIPNDKGRFVYVDYAHTPDALENVLKALRPLVQGRLIIVFGCGGDRDNTKRPLMGAVAGQWADLAVVTSDNPRSEDPQAIIDQIVPGTARHMPALPPRERLNNDLVGRGYAVEADRRKAITLAVNISKPEDTILIAGKGHETYQIIGERTINFDDRQEARKALEKLE